MELVGVATPARGMLNFRLVPRLVEGVAGNTPRTRVCALRRRRGWWLKGKSVMNLNFNSQIRQFVALILEGCDKLSEELVCQIILIICIGVLL